MRFIQSPPSHFALATLAVLFAAALVIAPSAFTPDVKAVESLDCYCDLGQSTQPRWGKGATCAASLADLDAQAFADFQNDAPTVCDPPCLPFGPGEGCDPQLVITAPCYWNSQQQTYITDGRYRYGCFTCP